MLLFIRFNLVHNTLNVKFQYISCCYLSVKGFRTHCVRLHVSIHLMLLFIAIRSWLPVHQERFNTSHVVIYLNCDIAIIFIDRFQYISCCYLSFGLALGCILDYRFNTSHVVIYQRAGDSTVCTSKVSIHLMLLFIGFLHGEADEADVFQYISCCYLSGVAQRNKRLKVFVSIHLMLLFIEISGDLINFLTWFQYISCCYLSKTGADYWCFQLKFQYISCCYLSVPLRLFSFFIFRFNTSHVVIYQFLVISSKGNKL